MVAAKSLALGLLVVSAIAFSSPSAEAGAIIAAGSSGTMYIGRGNGSPDGPAAPAFNLFAAEAAAPVPTPPPAAPVVAAAVVPTPPPAPSFPPVTPTPTTPYDAFINFGNAPFADQGLLTTGNAQPWFTSDAVLKAFGHAPSAQEMNDFSQTVLARVESTFAGSGLTIQATTDPNAPAAHMLSVTSGLSAASNPNAVGITNVGRNGFDFIDKLGYANSPDQLEWAVAHNVAHELMHAFGGSHHTTPDGNNLDAPISNWSVMIDPNTGFSAASVAEMTYNLRQGGLAARNGQGAQMMGVDGQELIAQPVPEPATMVLWGAVAGIAGLIRVRSKRS